MGKRIQINLDFDNSTKTSGKYLVFDTETIGLPINKYAPPDDIKNWPYVVQIAWILFDDEHKLIEHNNFYLKQPVEIPAAATNVHGITTAMMLEKGIGPSNVYANFKKAIDNTEYLISHNIDFDVPTVQCDFLRNGIAWDFPKNKMFCTMKTGTNFCKIQQGNGNYKWPTLAELYQKCFYPGYSMKGFYQDISSVNNVHNALIDAGLTAQCFFKLKDLGLFKEFGAKAMENNLPAEQISENFENLHNILDKGVTDNCKFWYTKIAHLGLGTYRVLKDEEQLRLDNAVAAQFKKWDEQWAKTIHKNKSQAEKEVSLKIAEQRTRDAQEKQKQIDDLLIDALKSDFWDSLIEKKEYTVQNPKNNLESMISNIPKPTPPSFEELPEKPNGKSDWLHTMTLGDQTLYQVQLDLWKRDVDRINLFNSDIKDQYEKKLNEYGEEIQIVQKHYDKLEEEWGREKEKETHNNIQRQHNNEKLIEKYLTRNNEAIIEYCLEVLNNSQYLETFPKQFDLDYNSEKKLLFVEYVLPAPDDLPRLTGVKYIAAKKELKESFLSETQFLKNYDAAIYKITLRTLHELFQADKADALEIVIFNGWVNAINKATGKNIRNCIVTIQAKKAEFNEIELSNVDPKICFKHLNGIGGNKLANITAVKPIAQITSRL